MKTPNGFIQKASIFIKGGGCTRLFTRLLIAGVLFIVVLAIFGAGYQNLASANTREAFPPPGQLVDVGGIRLHLYCLGEGSPTVILEAGLGGSVYDWGLVHEKLAATTRVCAYDRAGLGWSDSVTAPLFSAEMAQVLHTLLQNAGIEGSFVMVGHSAGGLQVRAFANQFPEEVVGMVLVDSSHENQILRFPAEVVEQTAEQGKILTYCQLLAPVGVVRLFGLAAPNPETFPLPDAMFQAVVANSNRTDYCHTIANENKAIATDAGQPNPPAPLGDLPLFVLTAGIGPGTSSFNAGMPGMTAELAQQMDTVWNELQNELAALSSNSTHQVAENSSHYIQLFQPELVIEAVEQIVRQVR